MESVAEVPEEASGLRQPRFWIRVFLLLNRLPAKANEPCLPCLSGQTHTHTHTTVLLLCWNLSGTTRVSRYQKGKTSCCEPGSKSAIYDCRVYLIAQVFNGLSTTDVEGRAAAAAATEQFNGVTATTTTTTSRHETPAATAGVPPTSDTVSRSVSSGRLTSSSSDDLHLANASEPAAAAAAQPRKSTSLLATVTSTLKRALRRHASSASERLVPREPTSPRTPQTDTSTPPHVADDVTVTSSSDVIALVLAGGGKVTYF